MKIGLVITHTHRGSPSAFARTCEIFKHTKNDDIKPIILTPFPEDVNNTTDVDIQLIPTTISKIGLSSFTYKLTRMLISSSKTSQIMLSRSSIGKMVNSISSGLRKVLEVEKFDILHAVQPIAALACIPIAKEFNIPLVTELCSSWPEYAVASEQIKNNDKTFSLLRNLEQNIIDLSNVIMVVSETQKLSFIETYSTGDTPIVVVQSGGPIIDLLETRRKNNVVYAGSANPQSHVDLFARSIEFVKNSASFFISDVGDSINDIKKITKQYDVPIEYFWFKSRKDYLKLLMKSKIGILPLKNDPIWKLAISVKAFDYLACGLPIVSNDVGNWWNEVIKKENVGIVTNDDPKDFANSIDTILEDENLWNRMHGNAINLIKTKLNWNIIAKDIIKPTYYKLLH